MLVFAFFSMLLLIFAAVALALRPTTEQKAVGKRLLTIRGAGKERAGGNAEVDALFKEAKRGKFGQLEEFLQNFSFAATTQLLILQSDSKMTVGGLAVYSVVIAVVVFALAYLFTGMITVAVVLSAVGLYARFGLLTMKRKRRVDAFAKALPEAVDMMARALRAGHSMVAAIGIIAEHASQPVAGEFSEVFRKQNFGLPLRDAMIQLLDRVPSQDLRVVVTGILVQKDTGGNLAEIMDRTVNVIRERIRIQGEIKTHTAQGRLTGWILCLLPLVMLVLINIINPGYSRVLVTDSFGRLLCYVGVALLIIGAFIIRQIINGIEV